MYVIKSGDIFSIAAGVEKEFVSPFADELFRQDVQSWGHDSWKFKEDEGEPEKGLVPRSMLWGGAGKINKPARVKASYVYGVPGRLYYVLEMSKSSGLFYFDFSRDQE